MTKSAFLPHCLKFYCYFWSILQKLTVHVLMEHVSAEKPVSVAPPNARAKRALWRAIAQRRNVTAGRSANVPRDVNAKPANPKATVALRR